MIRLVIADDHPVVREGLRIIFESDSEIAVVEEITQGKEVCNRVTALWPQFDILILDVRMPHFDPIATVQQLTNTLNDIKILVLSSYDNPEYVTGLLNAGARGYMLKDEPRMTLISAARIVTEGDMYISPKIAHVYVQRQRRLLEDHDHLMRLTEREKEVLRLVGSGCDNQQIATTLTISGETVKNHLRNVYSKLGILNRYQAIVFAFRNGIAHVD